MKYIFTVAEFQPFGDRQELSHAYSYLNDEVSAESNLAMFETAQQLPRLFPHPDAYNTSVAEIDEPSLLEELEIYPDRIFEKVFAVLNPFHKYSVVDDAEFLLKDTDLAGPLAFCVILATCLFITSSKAHFGYIYGLSVMSCLMIYGLLTLMSSQDAVFSITSVASILGYCLLPVVGLSVLRIVFSFNCPFGIILSFIAIIWSSIASSRLFSAMSGDSGQQPLIAYPCALVYGVFVLLIIF